MNETFPFYSFLTHDKSVAQIHLIKLHRKTENYHILSSFLHKTSPNKTMAVNLRYKSLYISLPSSAKLESEMTKFPEERERRHLFFRIPIWN